ncbi:TonB C-terminal domain-containing protein, partial [bacterium]|nr:TonB C-terminal domain-containing protein [bacterium]
LYEQFDIYPEPLEEDLNDLASINNGSDRPVEYINSENEYFEEYQTMEDGSAPNAEEQNSVTNAQKENINISDANVDDNLIQTQEAYSAPSEVETAENIQTPEYIDETVNISNGENSESEVSAPVANSAEIAADAETGGEYDDYELEIPQNSKKSSKGGIAAILALLILAGGGIGAGLYLKNNSNNIKTVNDSNQEAMFETIDDIESENIANNESSNAENTTDTEVSETLPQLPAETQEDTYKPKDLTEQDVLPQQAPEPNINDAMARAFTKGNNVTINGVNWLCSPQLFTDKGFKLYLQQMDEKIKLNLKNNILNASEVNSNPMVSAKISVNNDGTLDKVLIADSSGSSQVDEIVLQSIKETFEGSNPPIPNDSPLSSAKYYLKLIVKL